MSTDSSFYLQEYLEGDHIYQECTEYEEFTQNVSAVCDPLFFTGLTSFALIPSTIIYSLLMGIILLYYSRINNSWFKKQKLHIFSLLLAHILLSLVLGICNLLINRGFPWFGLKGIHLHLREIQLCKVYSSVNTFVNCLLVTLLTLYTIDITLYAKFYAYRPPTSNKKMILMVLFFSVLIAIPDYCVNTLWIFDGRLQCSTSPHLPRLLIFTAEVHRILFGYGLFQCIIIYMCLKYLRKRHILICNTVLHFYPLTFIKKTRNEIVSSICEFLNGMKKTTSLVIVYSSWLAMILLIRGCCQIPISLELYYYIMKSERAQAKLRLFNYWSLRDFMSFIVILFGSTHSWFYISFFKMVEFKVVEGSDRMLSSKRIHKKWKEIYQFLIKSNRSGDPEVEEAINVLKQFFRINENANK
uniref:Uncharacterized protein n=1 Tax=Trichobilharzia regenti TaxID=157069 RepID=A0AA85KIG9_TRIRE|nr:unnamed protein product [Trichobilharzia regenti]